MKLSVGNCLIHDDVTTVFMMIRLHITCYTLHNKIICVIFQQHIEFNTTA